MPWPWSYVLAEVNDVTFTEKTVHFQVARIMGACLAIRGLHRGPSVPLKVGQSESSGRSASTLKLGLLLVGPTPRHDEGPCTLNKLYTQQSLTGVRVG